MLAWMLGLVLEFRLGAVPVVIALTTVIAFIKLIRRSSARLGKPAVRKIGKLN